jgi:pimeloyl-ACP methyl ester carboxylesterase
MARLLLVHGAAHGAWCWERLVPELTRHGVDAFTLDLPAHGNDSTSPWLVTMKSYALAICKASKNEGSPIAVLGHSLAGAAISVAAEMRPQLFGHLMYLCALFPKDRTSMPQLSSGNGRRSGPLREGKLSLLNGTITVSSESAKTAFYDRLSDSEAQRHIARLVSEPVLPLLHRFRLSSDRFGKIPKSYIECTEDAALPINHQRWMRGQTRFEFIHTLACGHSPFFECPGELASIVSSILRSPR